MTSSSPEISVPRKKIEMLVDENEELKLKLKDKTKQLQAKEQQLVEKDNDLTEYIAQINKLEASKSKWTESDKKELQSEITSLRDLVDEKTTELWNAKLELDSTKSQLASAQRTIDELERPSTALDCSLPPSETSNAAEFAKLQEEHNNAVYQLQCAELREKNLQKQLNELQSSQDQLSEENFGLKQMLKDIRGQLMETESELNELKMANPMQRKGNSMFGEVADEYIKLENQTKEFLKELTFVKKENRHLKDELEEARLLATKREGTEKVGRCICDELKPELEQERLRGDHLQRKVHSLQSQLLQIGKGIKGREVGPMFKVLLDTLEPQLKCANKLNTDLRAERNSLTDQVISLRSSLRQSQSEAKNAREDEMLCKKQIALMRDNHAKELARRDNPELFEKELDAPKVSQTFKSAADCFSKLQKPSVTFETPAKKTSSTTAATPCLPIPAAPEDALRRLTLSRNSFMSDSTNETFTGRERKPRRAKPLATVKTLPTNSDSIQILVNKGQIIKEQVEAPLDDTAAIFGGPPSLPAAKFKVPTNASLFALPPLQPREADKTRVIDQSMELDATNRDEFEFDIEKSPFNNTTMGEYPEDVENDEPALV